MAAHLIRMDAFPAFAASYMGEARLLQRDGMESQFEPIEPSAKKFRALELDPQAHLAAVVASSDDPIISKNLDGMILSWNEAATRVFGFQPEEIVGRSILTLIPPELHHEEDEILRRLRAGERIEHFETTRMRKNGERFPISVTISPIKDSSGRVIGASKIARDISDKKKNEDNRLRLAAIVDSADDAIIGKDLNGVITSWNGAAHKIFGYTADEMIGESIVRLIPEDLRYEENEILLKLRAGQRIEHYETRRQGKNGEIIEVSITISPIKDEAGRVIGASKIARDISDRKQVERLLVQAEKLAATGRMAATIAHEINNPLEALMNVIFLARKYSAKDSRTHTLLLTAEGELERMAHIARQTLGYYKETNGPSEVHMHDLLENVLTVYNSKMISAGVKVDSRFNDLQKIVVSKGEMLQVFSNVIANGIDAMPHGGVLGVSVQQVSRAAGKGIQITIQDNGTGIKKEDVTRVFDPFFSTKGNLGTGIGLWVARQLVEQRGGQITIASTHAAKNSGTAVSIFVPFALPAGSPLGAANQ